MESAFVELLKGKGHDLSAADYLYRSSFDDLIEINIPEDSFRILYHLNNKLFLPFSSGSNSKMYQYAYEKLVHPDDRAVYRELMFPDTMEERISAEKTGILSACFRYRREDGAWRWVEQVLVGGSAFQLPDGVFHFFTFDIQNRMDRESGIEQMNYGSDPDTDHLTGLLRENAFFMTVQSMLDTGLSGQYCFALLDIENFRLYNDWYGRDEGDRLLSKIGAYLKGQEDITAGYMGQDDFCMVIPYRDGRLEEIYLAVRGMELQREGASGILPAIGAAMIEHRSAAMDLYDRAREALQEVKGDVRCRIKYFSDETLLRTDLDYRILKRFPQAMREHEIFFVLQPQCRISSGKIIGAESLARWTTADGEVISPGLFIPTLEKYGFVTELDKYIWEQVCICLKKWLDEGRSIVPVSVNVSRVDILSIDVASFLDQLTVKYSIPRNFLKVEITESAYVEQKEAVDDTIRKLHELGFKVYMDDFGSGYSSLNMLSSVSIDVLKIDAQFLRPGNSSEEEKGIRILESVVNMAKNMALPIIVEGVETESQISFLGQLGCRYIQGYYFYRPMPVRQFEELISDQDNLDLQGILFKANQQYGIREFMDETIYSDTMLNNLLGALAIYKRYGEDNGCIDIIRFNEQFYQTVNVPDFDLRLAHIERFIHPGDMQEFLGLMDKAEKDRMNGSIGRVGVYRTDGSLGQYLMRFYFLEEKEGAKKYYGSMQDITRFMELESHLKLMEQYASESFVFLYRKEGHTVFESVMHGLEDALELTEEQFIRELNEHRFVQRVQGQTGKDMCAIITQAVEERKDFRFLIVVKTDSGALVGLDLNAYSVQDEYTGLEYVIILRKTDGKDPEGEG